MATPDERKVRNNAISSPKLVFIWFVWVIVVLFAFSVYILQIPVYYSNLIQEAEALAGVTDISPLFYSTFVLFRDVVVSIAFVIVAFSLLRNRYRDPQILFVSLVLLLIGVAIPSLILTKSETILDIYADVVYTIAASLVIVFLFVLPDGKFYPRLSRILIPVLVILNFMIYTVSNFLPQLGWPSEFMFPFAVFWIFTYSMSYASRRLEVALGLGER